MKIRPVGAELFHTDRRDEANSRLVAILRTLPKSRGAFLPPPHLSLLSAGTLSLRWMTITFV
jgi:hypothetical protein